MKFFNLKSLTLILVFITGSSLTAAFDLPVKAAVAGLASGVIGAAAGAVIAPSLGFVFFLPILASPHIGVRMCKTSSKKEKNALKAFDILGAALSLGSFIYYNDKSHGEPNAFSDAALVASVITAAKGTIGLAFAPSFEESVTASH